MISSEKVISGKPENTALAISSRFGQSDITSHNMEFPVRIAIWSTLLKSPVQLVSEKSIKATINLYLEQYFGYN